jgi:hypothetical protein
MFSTDNVDKYILFRRILKNRKDVLQDVHCLYILTVLRQLNKGSNPLSIDFVLRRINRTTSKNIIHASLYSLIDSNYVRQSSGKGSLYYITQEGLQALKDFNDAIECADYVNYNKKPPISKKVKRPGL